MIIECYFWYFWQPAFREDIRREGIVETIVKHLKGGNVSLRTLCATALFKVRGNILYFKKLDKCELFLNVLSSILISFFSILTTVLSRSGLH